MLRVITFLGVCIFILSSPVHAEIGWPEGQFESKFEEVRGSKMHYVEHGEGDPILLIHGIPTWSYLWRDMIEPLSKHGRVIAVDMIGYGKSDKPNLRYRLSELQVYLRDFIKQKDLRNIRLVVHDLGGPVALPVAAQNRDRFSAIIAFETIFGPIASEDHWNDFQRSIDDKGGIIGPGGEGYGLVVRDNIFLDITQQALAGTHANIAEYAAPFEDPLARFSIYRPFQDIPVAGKPRYPHYVQKHALWYLRKSPIPKLYIYPEPGFATQIPEGSPEMASTFRNVDIVPFGPGFHFLQEESAEHLSGLISDWLQTLE